MSSKLRKALKGHPRIFISASFVPSFLVGCRKAYSGRREATSLSHQLPYSSVWEHIQGLPQRLDHLESLRFLTQE